jgi:DUF4097 and DUF4098 domain-containing protein YvlB
MSLVGHRVATYRRVMESGVARPIVRVSSEGYRVRVVAKPGAGVAVDGSALIDTAGNATTIDTVRSSLTIEVPEDSDMLIGATSGRVKIAGRVGHVAVVSESGRVDVEEAGSIDVRTESARVEVGRVADECRVRTNSGRVEVDSCGSADVSTESGRIEVSGVEGAARAHCVSGRITLDLAAAGDVEAESVSGRISVSLPAGTRIHRADRMDPNVPRPPDTDCTVAARSVSGSVEVSTR